MQGKEERSKMKKDPKLSRRNFLKGTVMGAGALTAGVAGGLALPGTARAAVPPSIPLPFCFAPDGVTPTTTPNASNVTVLDPDDVRVMGWYYYTVGGNG
jgi:hypothetical protein